jgi:hypothetical protein
MDMPVMITVLETAFGDLNPIVTAKRKLEALK